MAQHLSKNELADARRTMEDQKVKDAVERYRFLLGQTDLFKHFLKAKGFTEEDLQPDENAPVKGRPKKDAATSRRGRKTEKEEDEELLKDELEEEEENAPLSTETVFQSSPTYVTGGTLRDYQIQGLNWLVSMSERRLSGILADEMGLVSFLSSL
jgi:SWI/SNF-related matrix-associated actin-dependent regulator of chromatin subfamily A member 5